MPATLNLHVTSFRHYDKTSYTVRPGRHVQFMDCMDPEIMVD